MSSCALPQHASLQYAFFYVAGQGLVHRAHLRPCSAHHAIQVSVMPCMQGLAQPETVRKVLQSVYVDESAVDDELVDIILQPAFTANALQVFVSVITGE